MDTQEARSEHSTGAQEANMVKSAAVAIGYEHSAPKSAKTTTHRKSSYDRGVQIAAARLRVTTDRRIGEATPDWVKTLAAEKPSRHAS